MSTQKLRKFPKILTEEQFDEFVKHAEKHGKKVVLLPEDWESRPEILRLLKRKLELEGKL